MSISSLTGQSRTLVLIPARNEMETLPGLVRAVELQGYAVTVLDGRGTDGMPEWIRYQGKELIGNLAGNDLARTFWRGFCRAKERDCVRVITMDAGGSHDPAVIPALLNQLADVVIGSRFIAGGRTENHPWSRVLLSRSVPLLLRLLWGLCLQDATSGFRAYGPKAIERLAATPPPRGQSGFAWHLEALWRCRGLEIAETPIVYRGSSSSISLNKIIECLILLWRLRSGG